MLASDGYILSWEPQDGEVAESGDLGYTWGKYTVTAKNPDGAAMYRYGKYLNVWKNNPPAAGKFWSIWAMPVLINKIPFDLCQSYA